ncbi:hypothetical protein BC941DRAFT_410697 [Chlamydoabsidia padenii]|nr:hypothetical protein BC941DRAFT_410697 [Chlamydoabsidia padenii]
MAVPHDNNNNNNNNNVTTGNTGGYSGNTYFDNHLDYYHSSPYPDYINGHSPPLGNLLTPPAESTQLNRRPSNNRLGSSKQRKQAKRSPMHSTATPSEYFHRNLLDAVSNVEDSDENEYYVYPYSGSEHNGNTSDHHHSNSLLPKKSTTGLHLLQKSLSSLDLNESSTRRPKLRSYVMDPHSTPRHSTRRHQQGGYLPIYQDGYASDDESESLLWFDHPPPRRIKRQQKQEEQQEQRCLSFRLVCGFLSLIFFLCFMMLIYGEAKPLEQLTIRMGRVLASDKELIFDLQVTAYNPNPWTVHVDDADISVFAFSRIVPLSLDTMNHTQSLGADPAEYLGSFYHFDEPLAFSSSFLSSQPSQAISQIRIKSPGDDQGGNGRWSRMIRYQYGLLARGVLTYHSLGLPGVYSQTVAICNEAQVDPDTGVVSNNNSNQGYCVNNGN